MLTFCETFSLMSTFLFEIFKCLVWVCCGAEVCYYSCQNHMTFLRNSLGSVLLACSVSQITEEEARAEQGEKGYKEVTEKGRSAMTCWEISVHPAQVMLLWVSLTAMMSEEGKTNPKTFYDRQPSLLCTVFKWVQPRMGSFSSDFFDVTSS